MIGCESFAMRRSFARHGCCLVGTQAFKRTDPSSVQQTSVHTLHPQAFTGKEGPDDPIYVALQGEVYDVSEARDFYGPEGVYGGFAGHDVTKAFALNSLEEKDLDVTECVWIIGRGQGNN